MNTKQLFSFMLALLVLGFFSTQSTHARARTAPKLTVVCIIDQWPMHICSKELTYLNGGIKHLVDKGTFYTHMYYPHARPTTATGHTALATGTYAMHHGVVANSWYNEKNVLVNAGDDATFGTSSNHIMCSTLAEEARAQGFMNIAISLKDRAAISMIGKGGPAFWFDDTKGEIVSSPAYTKTLPPYAVVYNRFLQDTLHKQTDTEWEQQYDDESGAYSFTFKHDYRYTGHPFPLINRKHKMPSTPSKKRYELWQKTPAANKMLLRFAVLAIRNHFKQTPNTPLILWLSLSSLDLVGHFYGPNSKEAIDMLYHIDHQLETFISQVEKTVGEELCLWALTSDHGIMPIPELLKERGIHQARRIDSDKLLATLNKKIYRRFGVKRVLKHFNIPYFYLDHDKKTALKKKNLYKTILTFIKNELRAITGIIQVWDHEEIETKDFEKLYGLHARETWYQKQFYPGRSGEIICQVAPYTYLTNYKGGTSHISPYDYDVRVPLMLRWPGHTPLLTIDTRTNMLQFTGTLARMLQIPAPEEALRTPLPGTYPS